MTETLTAPEVHEYEAPGGSGAPRVANLPGVDHSAGPQECTVESVMYDTEDLRLARAGVSVTREGDEWVLQRPGAEPQRSPAAEDDPPATVVDLVRGHTRGHPLLPVARTQTTRSVWQLLDEEGTLLAEISADAVSGQTLGSTTTVDSWDRITVALAGQPDGLLPAIEERLADLGASSAPDRPVLQRLLGAGAVASRGAGSVGRKSSAGEVVLAAVAAQVQRLVEHDPLVRCSEPDAVHQMRVATRQLRSMMRTFRPVLDVDRDLVSELRRLAGVLGEARDQEVIQERVEALLASTPDEDVLGPVAAKLTQQFAREQADAHTRVLAELDSERYGELLDTLDALLADPPLTPLAQERATTALPPLVRKTVRKLDKAVDTVHELPQGPERAEALHDVRKAAKQARYAAELVAPALGKDAERSAQRFKDVQSLLGDHQDAVQTRAFLRALGGRGHLAGQNSFTVGIWYEREAGAAADIDAAFEDLWRRAADRKHRRWLR